MKKMNQLKELFLGIGTVVLVFVAVAGIVYGAYWLTKTLSYSFFYEDMVQRTVTEMVKPEYLK